MCWRRYAINGGGQALMVVDEQFPAAGFEGAALSMRVLVAGGGIGGLTTALSLHEAGIDVAVVESARRIDAIGAGINLLPHAVRELTELGLGDALEAAAVATAELVYHDRFGNRIHSEPRGRAAGYRWPQYSIHRGALQRLLLERGATSGSAPTPCAAGSRSSASSRPATACAPSCASAPPGGCGTVDADVLIGADGIDSAVRAQLHPGEGPPRWAGIAMWRGVSEAAPFLTGRTMIMAGSNMHAKFVAYPIGARDGRALVNWVAEVRRRCRRASGAHDWRRTVDSVGRARALRRLELRLARRPRADRRARRRSSSTR